MSMYQDKPILQIVGNQTIICGIKMKSCSYLVIKNQLFNVIINFFDADFTTRWNSLRNQTTTEIIFL